LANFFGPVPIEIPVALLQPAFVAKRVGRIPICATSA